MHIISLIAMLSHILRYHAIPYDTILYGYIPSSRMDLYNRSHWRDIYEKLFMLNWPMFEKITEKVVHAQARAFKSRYTSCRWSNLARHVLCRDVESHSMCT